MTGMKENKIKKILFPVSLSANAAQQQDWGLL